ncbi:MAG: transglutaminase domain-containing protein [Lachnospiraceae bacterium]|nr:transglutaminase domain-containing protein [Lachnospiraceae bacterium]
MKKLFNRLILLFLILAMAAGSSGCGSVFSKEKADYAEERSEEKTTADTEKEDSDTEAENMTDVVKQEAGKFYYNQLSNEEQDVYEAVYDGLQNLEENIKMDVSDEEEIHKIYKAVLNDHPDIFWCDNSYQYSKQKLIFTSYALMPRYLFTEEEIKNKQKEIEKTVESCLSGISQNATDYEKILYIYEYVINETDYDEAAVSAGKIGDDQNIDSVFLRKKSVCAGYTRATQYLLNRLGVFCTYVEGTAESRGDSHTWNLVICGGDYYYVDTTWGDPIFSGEVPDQIPESARINYNYLCCNDEQLFKTHTLEDDFEFDIPKCTKMDWNYYVVNGRYYDHYDGQEIWSVIKDDITKKKESSVFKFSDEEVYRQACEQITDKYTREGMQLIQQLYGNRTIQCYHTNSEEEGIVQIYWEY